MIAVHNPLFLIRWPASRSSEHSVLAQTPPRLRATRFGAQPSLRALLRAKAGTRGGGRTHNLRLRRPTLYPIELLAQVGSTVGQSFQKGNLFSGVRAKGESRHSH